MSSATSGEWLVPFKGRHYSGHYDQNFLWRHGNLYVMDNHRAALWCWLQHVDPRKPYSLFHIDRHYDTLDVNMTTWMQNLPRNWRKFSIDEYLTHSYEWENGKQINLFSYDNYLSIFFRKFRRSLNACYLATHNDGDKPRLKFCDPKPWELAANLDYWIKRDVKPWIANVDLDYFFCDDAHDDRQQMMSDDYINQTFEAIRLRMADGSIGVTTIALSPEYTGGWKPSERVMEIAMAKLGIEFRLPSA